MTKKFKTIAKIAKIGTIAVFTLGTPVVMQSCGGKEVVAPEVKTVKVTLNYAEGDQSFWYYALPKAERGSVIEFIDAQDFASIGSAEIKDIIKAMITGGLTAKSGTVIYVSTSVAANLTTADLKNLENLGIKIDDSKTKQVTMTKNDQKNLACYKNGKTKGMMVRHSVAANQFIKTT